MAQIAFDWHKQRSRRDFYSALLFLAPNFLGFLAFVAFPVAFSLAMAFTNWDLTNRDPLTVVGLENFRSLLNGEHSRHFWKYFLNTIYFMMGMPISIAGSLILAILLSKPVSVGRRYGPTCLSGTVCLVVGLSVAAVLWSAERRDAAFWVLVFTLAAGLGASLGVVFFRTMFYLPQLTSGVALFILWKNLYNPQFGPLNQVLRHVLSWLSSLADSVPPLLPRILSAAVIAGLVWLLVRRWRDGIAEFRDEGAWYLVKLVVSSAFSIAAGVGLAWCLWHFPELAAARLEPPQWLTSVDNLWAMDPEHITPRRQFFGLGARDAIIIMGIWTAVGGANMLLYLAGLSNIPDELYEAAEVDGAGRWAKFRNVTWPQLAPTTFFIVIISTIVALQGGFEQARVMTRGGPAGTTVTLGYYIYMTGFQEFRLGLASAVCWIMFLIIFAVTLVNWRFGNRYVNA